MLFAGPLSIGICAFIVLLLQGTDSPPPSASTPPCICDTATSSAICPIAMALRYTGCASALRVRVSAESFVKVGKQDGKVETEAGGTTLEKAHRVPSVQTHAETSSSATMNVQSDSTPGIDITVSGSGTIHISREAYRGLIAGIITTSSLLALGVFYEIIKLVRRCLAKRRARRERERLERLRRAGLIRRLHDCGAWHGANEPCDFTNVRSHRKDDRGGGRDRRGDGGSTTVVLTKNLLEVIEPESTPRVPLAIPEESDVEENSDDGISIEASSSEEDGEDNDRTTFLDALAKTKRRMFGDQLPEKPALQKATKVLEQNKRRTNDTLFSDEDESAATNGGSAVAGEKKKSANGAGVVRDGVVRVDERDMNAAVRAQRKTRNGISGVVEGIASAIVDNVDERIAAVRNEHAVALRQLQNPQAPLLDIDFDTTTNASEIAAYNEPRAGQQQSLV